MNNALKIGVTGNIGSGKSTICKIFELLNVPVYYADDRAKQLMHQNKQLQSDIKKTFGNDVYTLEGNLNRSLLAERAFKDKNATKLLNAIVHPIVKNDFVEWHNTHLEKPYVVEEAALLFESGSYLQLDKIIVVSAPELLRIKRVMSRDQVSEEQVVARIKQQLSQEEKENRADYVIRNDEKLLVIPQVLTIHQIITH